MSGHSKWSTIKRKKGAADQKRGKMFTRCIHEITVAVREGGSGDPDANPRLRFALDKAKAVNMPGDTVERAIRRATGEEKSDQQQELTYEGYGPGGAAILLEVVTDNKNRTVGEVRSTFTRHGGSLGENGCVSWMFKKKGVLLLSRGVFTEDELLESALEAGAEDVKGEGDFWEVTTEPTAFHDVRTALSALAAQKKTALEGAELQFIPSTWVELRGKEAEQIGRLLEALDDLDDVMNVSANAQIIEE